MATATLHFLGQERDLIRISVKYKKEFWAWNGMPASIPLGGMLVLEFATHPDDNRFEERITTIDYNRYKMGYPMDEGEIIFYDASSDIIKRWKFADTIIKEIKTVFYTEGETPMMTYLVLSPAIQNYGHLHLKSWNISHTEPEPYKTPIIATENKKQYFVEEIKILNLDEGSTNSGENNEKGIIHNKEYTLKASKFRNNKAPENLNSIKWCYSYVKENETVIGNIKQTGEEITFKTDDLDYCGYSITFYAYIEKKENEAELEVFHHYRFKWFDRKIVEQQIEERLEKPWKINQGGTSLCGMACLFYIFAKNDKQGYKTLAETLHRTGKATHNGYTVEPDEDVKEEMYNTNPKTSKEHPWIPEVDWITMATTRSKESDFGYTGKKGQDASAINWPWLMTNLGKKLLGYTTVEMDYYKVNKSYIRDFFGSDEKIRILEEDIDKDYKNGYEICMMIDADMMYNKPDYDITDFGEYHWITYEDNLEILNSKGKTETDYDEVTDINFDVVTWGDFKRDKGIDKKKLRLSKASFRNNYYGYLKLK
ncbi:hypothetical protein A8C32_05385 [Flavivirga aquatica]|uniref:Uncharacterized protein n=1 Tax=Flavivirga aquatica TaxID=1849968 RepID=A0A1E5SHP1_9FLAO|nr:type VI secretion system tube protein TssD [Flavivirga aquatica]OEJ98632.1 hypothetical protein A8C32_05385 [Flavivirga aquatica]